MGKQHDHSMIRNVIRYRVDKFTHQIEVRKAAEIDEVSSLGWFEEAATWGRHQRPDDGVPENDRLARGRVGPAGLTTGEVGLIDKRGKCPMCPRRGPCSHGGGEIPPQ